MTANQKLASVITSIPHFLCYLFLLCFVTNQIRPCLFANSHVTLSDETQPKVFDDHVMRVRDLTHSASLQRYGWVETLFAVSGGMRPPANVENLASRGQCAVSVGSIFIQSLVRDYDLYQQR